MRPGPQRGVLMIGTRVCTKSIRFLHLEKKKEKKKKKERRRSLIFSPHIPPQMLSFSKAREILKFAFMWSTLRRFLWLTFNSCIRRFSLSNGCFSRSDLPVNHRHLSVFLTRADYSAAVGMYCIKGARKNERVRVPRPCLCQCVCVCVCIPDILCYKH